jgi:hypothetical protein
MIEISIFNLKNEVLLFARGDIRTNGTTHFLIIPKKTFA